MAKSVFEGGVKPNSGPAFPYPNANNGVRVGGDAMSDAVKGIQHAGSSPQGGNVPQTSGVRPGTTHADTPNLLGGPSDAGTTIATTPDPDTVGANHAKTASPSDLSDPGVRTGKAFRSVKDY